MFDLPPMITTLLRRLLFMSLLLPGLLVDVLAGPLIGMALDAMFWFAGKKKRFTRFFFKDVEKSGDHYRYTGTGYAFPFFALLCGTLLDEE